jgi:hypothetical protein
MAFLRDCDLVKFAEHNPSIEEIAEAVNSCRAFISATRGDASERGGGEGETRGHGDAERGRRGERESGR